MYTHCDVLCTTHMAYILWMFSCLSIFVNCTTKMQETHQTTCSIAQATQLFSAFSLISMYLVDLGRVWEV